MLEIETGAAQPLKPNYMLGGQQNLNPRYNLGNPQPLKPRMVLGEAQPHDVVRHNGLFNYDGTITYGKPK